MATRIEKQRILYEEMTAYEKKYWNEGIVVGVDEVGRGPFAGPVTICAYAFKPNTYILGVNDSKKLSKKRREEMYSELISIALDYVVVSKSPEVIDEVNILNATKIAMKEAIEKLKIKPRIILVDAVNIPDINYEQLPIIKGDSKSISIAAASIVAKYERDNYMLKQDELYPQYDFKNNMGYGTKRHIEAIKKYGLTEIHRRSFCKKYE